MAPSRKSKTWADGDLGVSGNSQSNTSNKAQGNQTTATRKHDDGRTSNGKSKLEDEKSCNPHLAQGDQPAPSNDATVPIQSRPTEPAELEAEQTPHSDADWLRSRTSRLLGLIDEDEEDQAMAPGAPFAEANSSDEDNSDRQKPEPRSESEPCSKNDDNSVPQKEEPPDANISAIRTSGRLFVRNLPYKTTEDHLQSLFSTFGKTDEVCSVHRAPPSPQTMIPVSFL